VPSLLDIFLVLIGFLPQVFLMYLFLYCIEQSGLLPRIAKFLHIPAKEMLTVALGFGCTTLAVCSIKKDVPKKRRSAMAAFLSFIPCGAQIPLIVLLAGSVLHLPFYTLFIIYIAAIVLGLCAAKLFSANYKYEYKPESADIKFPNVLNALKEALIKTLSFIKKISVAFVISAFIVTVLAKFSFALTPVAEPRDSVLFSICGVLSPVFAPIGLSNPAVICALLFGAVAKESAVTVLLFFPEVLSGLSIGSGLSLITFYVLYPVCVSCLMAIKTNCGRKALCKIAVVNLLFAYVFAFIVYNVCAIL
jgi:ferrous iron transport protein B